MNIIDFLIIYFSIGAPFGAYTYFQNRAESKTNDSRLKTLVAFFFWLPTAFRLARKYKLSDKTIFLAENNFFSSNPRRNKNSYPIQKQLEKLLLPNRHGISIFEFRETLERYVGLTVAAKSETSDEPRKDFFAAAQNKNAALAAKCFYRRNRARLFFHQTSARRDFLRAIADLSAEVSDKRKFVKSAFRLVDNLEDFEARDVLRKIFVGSSPEYKHFAEKTLEKNLWKPEIRKSLNADSISTLTRTMNSLPKKD